MCRKSVSPIHHDMPLGLSSTKKVKIEDTNIQINTTPEIKNYGNFDSVGGKLGETHLLKHMDQVGYNSAIESPCLLSEVDHLIPQKCSTSVNTNERNQIIQREHIFNVNYVYPYSRLMKHYFKSQIVGCCSANHSHSGINQKDFISSGYEVINDKSSVSPQIEQHKVKSIHKYSVNQIETSQSYIRNYSLFQSDREFSIMDIVILNFLQNFSLSINVQQTQSFEKNIPIICRNMKDILVL